MIKILLFLWSFFIITTICVGIVEIHDAPTINND